MPQDKTILGGVNPEPIRQLQILQCAACLYVDIKGALPAVTIVEGMAVCYGCMSYVVQETDFASILRMVARERRLVREEEEMRAQEEAMRKIARNLGIPLDDNEAMSDLETRE